MASCPCTCHPHTQWGADGTADQRDSHPDCECVCCAVPHPSGFFASEQERLAEEAAWHDQVEQEQANLPAVIDNGSAPAVVDEVVDEPVNPLDIPDEYDLPMYGSIMMCPKCRGDRVKTEYHPHGVLSGPCGNRFGWPNVQNLGEHLCRTCANCSYGWPEAVAHGAA